MVRVRSIIHVIIQFSILAYFFLFGPFVRKPILLIPQGAGILLAALSIWVMRKSKLTIFPEPVPGFKLITTGPYRVIRHPMYTSLLLYLMPFVFDGFSVLKLLLLLIFSINLILKLHFEEKLLLKLNPDYGIYCKSTWRIIPILY